ncbi:sec-independent protein translocase protein [Azospirillum sp. B510]|uniref:twin-arginine translocase TatA/TatE family subunit n=1 Tax=Azospirillum sp. (strain B510) TaxID=137722 RepID=UPI0001C4C08E|nr:twin-arginine translocase TatA/TatE family subunit [Azospirillum sp. B510]BAI72898.1 sec-independent protein translocase protein [Azospirillum sp. B510]
MGSFSIWHWLIVLVIVLLLFGAGKLPSVMGDIAKGVKAFKAGLKDEEAAQAPPQAPAQTAAQPSPAAIDPAPTQPVAAQSTPAHPTAQPGDPAKPTQG